MRVDNIYFQEVAMQKQKLVETYNLNFISFYSRKIRYPGYVASITNTYKQS